MTGVFYVPLRYHGGGTDTEKELAHKVDSGEEILPLLLPGFELATFQSQVWHSNQQAIPVIPLLVHNKLLRKKYLVSSDSIWN